MVVLKGAEAHKGGFGAADACHLVGLGADCGNAEHIGCDLADLITLGTAAAQVDFLKAVTCPFFHEAHAVHKCEVDALDDGSVNMNTGMAV